MDASFFLNFVRNFHKCKRYIQFRSISIIALGVWVNTMRWVGKHSFGGPKKLKFSCIGNAPEFVVTFQI